MRIHHRRRGFTLVEILVVIAVIVALLGLVAVVAPRFGERQRPSTGAMQLQSWLNIAKQRALRDQRPRGIRLPPVSARRDPPPPATPTASHAYVTELQYIELPEIFTGGELWIPYNNGRPISDQPPTADRYTYALLRGVELPYNSSNPLSDLNAIRPGDILKVDEPNCDPRRIRAIKPIPDGTGDRNDREDPRFPRETVYLLTLDAELIEYPLTNPPAPTGQPQTRQYPANPPAVTGAYRIIRSARPIPGEPVLTLPKDVGIDISREFAPPGVTPRWYRLYPPTANNGGNEPFDIMFDPSGRVIGTESTLGSRICLWVRDISADVPPTQLPDGDNTLITIYTRTGLIAAHPVDPTGLEPNLTPNQNPPFWNPFRFTQDGRSSGGQ